MYSSLPFCFLVHTKWHFQFLILVRENVISICVFFFKCLGPWRIRIWFCCEFSFEKLAWKAQGRVFFDFFFANGVCFDGSAECGWIIKFLRIMPVSGNVDWMWISGFVYHQLLFDLFVGVYVFTLWVLSEVIQWWY